MTRFEQCERRATLRAGGIVGAASGSQPATWSRATPARGEPLVVRPAARGGRPSARRRPRRTEVLIGPRSWRLVRHAVDAVDAGRPALRDGGRRRRRRRPPSRHAVRRPGRRARRASNGVPAGQARRAGRGSSRSSARRASARPASRARRSTRLEARATCLVGQSPAGNASTYAPLRDALEPLAGGSSGALGGRGARGRRRRERRGRARRGGGRRSRVERAGRRHRVGRPPPARGARAQPPVLLVLEDLHWATPAFLDLVEHVAGLARAPILVLGLARPELLDTRPDWAGGRLNASTVLLDSLAEPDARRPCWRSSTAGAHLTDERRSGILAAAGGNPLFLEQLVAAARDARRRRDPGQHPCPARSPPRRARRRRAAASCRPACRACGLSFPVAIVERLAERDAGDDPQRARPAGFRRAGCPANARRAPLGVPPRTACATRRTRAFPSGGAPRCMSERRRSSPSSPRAAASTSRSSIGRHLEAALPRPRRGRSGGARAAAAGPRRRHPSRRRRRLRANGDLDVRAAADLLPSAAVAASRRRPGPDGVRATARDVLSVDRRRPSRRRDHRRGERSGGSGRRARPRTAHRHPLQPALWDRRARDAGRRLDDLRRRHARARGGRRRRDAGLAHTSGFTRSSASPAVWTRTTTTLLTAARQPGGRCALDRELRRAAGSA